MHSVTMSRDGALIVSGDRNDMVKRWDASTGEAIGEPMYEHSDPVTAIVISDDGKLIVTGSSHGTIRRWDARTVEAIEKPIKAPSCYILTLAISTDCNLTVSSSDNGSLRRWDARTGEQIGNDIKVPGREDKIVISIDGKTIGCGSKSNDYVQRSWTVTFHRPHAAA